MTKGLLLMGSWLLMSVTVAVADDTVTTNANGGQLFQFKFDPSQPLTYAVEMKSDQMNDTTIGQRHSLTRTTIDTRYRIKLTAVGTNADGTTSVYYEPYDYEQDSHILGPSGDIDSTTRDLAIVSKQNGIVTVDTQKGIGISQWQTMKQAVYPHLISGYMDFDHTGLIRKFEGDLPFVDNWQHLLQYNSNLFYVVFPPRPIAINDGWTNTYYFKTGGPVVFDGDGMVQLWSYTRGPDQTTSNGSVASFKLYMSFDGKDLTGYADQSGQRTTVDVPQQVQSMDATFQFDQKRGCLVSVAESDSSHVDLNMVVQGNSANGHSDSEGSISVTLVSP